MRELNKSRMILKLGLLLIVAFAFFTATGVAMQKTKEKPYKFSNVYGEFYEPTQEDIAYTLERGGLANWEILNTGEPLEITSVNIKGFRYFNDLVDVDITITDPKRLSLFREALQSYRMRRDAISDFTRQNSTTGTGGQLGVLFITTPKKKVVIGVSYYAFCMGISYPSSLTTFESWLLAQTVRDILKSEADVEMGDKTFNLLSGMKELNSQKEFYNKVTSEEEK